MDVNSLAHTKWNCKYHIVFAPKYRRKVAYGQLKRDIANILSTLCKRKGVKIVEAEICPDHVHMLIELPPNISVLSFVGYSDLALVKALNLLKNLPKNLPKMLTKICEDMQRYAIKGVILWKVKKPERLENKGIMGKIKVMFVCHGSIFRKRWKPWIYSMFWTLREQFTKNLLRTKISKKSLARI